MDYTCRMCFAQQVYFLVEIRDAGPEPEGDPRAAELFRLQPQDGGGPKWDPRAAELL